MSKGLFGNPALEEYSVSVDADPENFEGVGDDDLQQMQQQAEQQIEDGLLQVLQLGQAAEGMYEISAALEGYAPTANRPASAKALQSAFEGFLKAAAPNLPSVRYAALEAYAYPTQSMLQSVALENMQSIKKTIAAFIAKIRAMIARIIDAFKKLFDLGRWRNKHLRQRAEDIEAKVNKAKQDTGKTAHMQASAKTEYAASDVFKYLNGNGRILSPEEVIQTFDQHHKDLATLMGQRLARVHTPLFEQVRSAEEKLKGRQAAPFLPAELTQINTQLAQTLCYTPGQSAGHDAVDGRMERFDKRLAFGAMTLITLAPSNQWRKDLASDKTLLPTYHLQQSMRFVVKGTEQMRVLNLEQAELLQKKVKQHLLAMDAVSSSFEKNLAQLNKIESLVTTLSLGNQDTTVVVLMKQMSAMVRWANMCVLTYRSFNSALSAYDHKVCSAALRYIAASPSWTQSSAT